MMSSWAQRLQRLATPFEAPRPVTPPASGACDMPDDFVLVDKPVSAPTSRAPSPVPPVPLQASPLVEASPLPEPLPPITSAELPVHFAGYSERITVISRHIADATFAAIAHVMDEKPSFRMPGFFGAGTSEVSFQICFAHAQDKARTHLEKAATLANALCDAMAQAHPYLPLNSIVKQVNSSLRAEWTKTHKALAESLQREVESYVCTWQWRSKLSIKADKFVPFLMAAATLEFQGIQGLLG